MVNQINNIDVLNSLNSDFNLMMSNNNPYFESFRDLLPECNYNTVDSLNTNLINNNLFCLSMNCQSLRAKYVAITNLIDSLRAKSIHPGLIFCQETWKSDSFQCNIQGFNFFSESRAHGQGGGVGVFVRDDIHAELLSKKSLFIENVYESIAIKVDLPKIKTFIAVSLYRPNNHKTLNYNAQIELFFTHLANHLEELKKCKLPVYFFSDTNIDLLRYDNDTNSTRFNDILSSHGFFQVISKATRIHGDSKTLIDHVFTSDPCQNITSSGIIIDGVSDHFHPYITIDINDNTPVHKHSIREYRNFSDFNKDKFKADLQKLTWENVLQSEDPNLAASNFFDSFNKLFIDNFPLLKERINKRYKPINEFMSTGLLKSRRTKLKLSNKARLNPTHENVHKYNIYRNIYNSLIKKAKRFQCNHEILAANGDSKKIWNIINKNLNIKKQSKSIGPILVNDNLVSDEKEMANCFNTHFSNIGKDVVKEIPQSSTHFSDYLPPPPRNSFFIGPVTRLDMMYTILSIKRKKSQDINEISTDLLQHVVVPISAPLTHIFNISIQKGIFPDIFKMSKVIPIFKSNDKKDMSFYRGVTLTDSFSKVFEKIVNDKLTEFLVSTNFFFDHQFGFLKNRSTNHAIIDFINQISDNLNKGNILLGLFMDVKKCFDCISHDILFKKLENAGVRGISLNWFKSFFHKRQQKVKIGSNYSDNICDIDISTFQGSVLGVLMFLIFINDIYNCSELFKTLFADDISSLTVSNNLNDLMTKAQNDLNNLSNWYRANQLSLHPSKSYFMIFSTNRNIYSHLPKTSDNLPYLPLFFNNNEPGETDITKISLVKMIPDGKDKSIRMLGVLLDNKLNLSEHCKFLHGKISRSLFSLNQVKGILNKECMKLVFNAHVQSHLEYCSNILSMAPEQYLKPLKVVQKKALRIVCGKKYNEHTRQLFKKEKILPLAQLIEFNMIKFMADYKLGRLPNAFSGTWIENNQRPANRYNLRNAHEFNIPFVRCMTFFKHPLFSFPRIWNELPEYLKTNLDNRKSFLDNLKDHLLNEI